MARVRKVLPAHDALVRRHGPANGYLPSQCEWAHEHRDPVHADHPVVAVACGTGRHVLNVVTHPAARGGGLAPRLVREAFRTIRRLGHTYAETYAEHTNVPSLHALMRAGFVPVGASYEQGTVWITLTADLKLRGRRRSARATQRRS